MYLKAYAGIYISTEESLRSLQIMENTAKTSLNDLFHL